MRYLRELQERVFTRRRIAALAATALRESGAEGVLPTPLEAVRRWAGVETVVDVAPGEGILGAYWYEERAVFIDGGQSEPRRRFTEAHEAIHALCPWHRATLMLDDEERCSPAASTTSWRPRPTTARRS